MLMQWVAEASSARVLGFLPTMYKPRRAEKLAINLAQRGGETGSSGDPTNVWDLVQGGTAAARAIGHSDSRLEQERKWSSLLREPAA